MMFSRVEICQNDNTLKNITGLGLIYVNLGVIFCGN